MSNSASKEIDVRKKAWVAMKDCPMAQAALILGDKWTLLILREAFYGVVRYDDIQTDLSIPRSVLSDRLSAMTKSGLLEKFAYSEPGTRRRSGYRLSSKGAALAPVMLALTEWGALHVTKAQSPVVAVNSKTGERVTLCPVDSSGEKASWSNITLKLTSERESGSTAKSRKR